MYHEKSYNVVLNEIGVSKSTGLSADGVKNSIIKYGKNVISQQKEKGLFGRIFEALCEPMMLILLFAFAVTFGINLGRFFKDGSGNFFECLGILVAISISVVLTVVMEGRSKKAFLVLNRFSDNFYVKVKRGGETLLINQSELCVGDIVFIESGDKITADGRLIESNRLEVDESMLTGESKQIKKNSQVCLKANTPLAERENMVYSGTYVCGGCGVFVVTAVGDNAEVGRIAVGLQRSAISAPLEEKLTRLGKIVSILGGVSAVMVFFLSLFRLIILNAVTFESVENIFIEAIVLIVAAVPEGLPSTVAISLSLNVLKLAKSNALIKKLVATETIGSVSVICSDKTGTLTQNKMVVERFVAKNGWVDDKHLKDKYVALNCAVNSTAELSNKEIKGSKTEGALILALKSSGFDYKKLREKCRIKSVIPFSSDIKYMQTTVEHEGAEIVFLKGAPEVILGFTDVSDEYKKSTLKEIEFYQAQSKRVVAFCHKSAYSTVFDGFAVIDDKLREDVIESVRGCYEAGIRVKMLTGDNLATATAIAKKLGMLDDNFIAVNGDEIERMSDEELKSRIQSISVVARSTPEVKLRIVKAIQSLGEVVAVTGDGVNDAPAVRNADIGIAMGDGSEITKEASDVVLLDNSFSTIITAISFGRNIFRNFQRFITFQLTVNLSSMCIIFAYLLIGYESPFSSTALLWLNIIMDGPLALSLGLEKTNTSLLGQKPVKRSENILSKRVIARIVVHSAFIAFFVTMQQIYNFMNVSVFKKSTVTFAMFVFFQLFNAINCREVRTQSALKGITTNKLLMITGVLTLILQIIITNAFPKFFDTQALNALEWLKIIVVCSSVVVFSEGYKLIYRTFISQTPQKKIAKIKNGCT